MSDSEEYTDDKDKQELYGDDSDNDIPPNKIPFLHHADLKDHTRVSLIDIKDI
jgi:hypothetical protein